MRNNENGMCCCCPSYVSTILASFAACFLLSLSIYAYLEEIDHKTSNAIHIGLSSALLLPYIFVGVFKDSTTPRIILFSTHLFEWVYAMGYLIYIVTKGEADCHDGDDAGLCNVVTVIAIICMGFWTLYNIFV